MLRRVLFYGAFAGVIVLAVVVSYKYFILGQTDLGFKYSYRYCRNGVFTTQPKGRPQGELTYYKSEAKRVLLARCLPDDPKPPIACREMKEVAGECKEFSIWKGAGR